MFHRLKKWWCPDPPQLSIDAFSRRCPSYVQYSPAPWHDLWLILSGKLRSLTKAFRRQQGWNRPFNPRRHILAGSSKLPREVFSVQSEDFDSKTEELIDEHYDLAEAFGLVQWHVIYVTGMKPGPKVELRMFSLESKKEIHRHICESMKLIDFPFESFNQMRTLADVAVFVTIQVERLFPSEDMERMIMRDLDVAFRPRK